jgi:hypothetical protein
MSTDECARRIGLPVQAVRTHPLGTVATTRRGEFLVTETVARPYVPDVDDPAGEGEVGEPVRATEPKRTTTRKAGNR